MTTPAQAGYAIATITEWNLAGGGLGVAAKNAQPIKVDFNPHSLELRYSVSGRSPKQEIDASGRPRNQAPPSGPAHPTR